MADILKIENLSRFYGKRQVVKNISFSMESGSVTGLLGPNGAGKTTTFYMIVGFIKANGGKIILNGKNITRLPMYKRSRLGLGYLPQESSIFRKLTVEQNLKMIAETRKDLSRGEKKDLVEKLMVEFGITKVRNQFGYTLSGGERRRTEIARSLVTSPHFLLLDEPFAGIDPKAVYEIKQIVRQLSEQGIGVLITDHNVRDTLAITSCAYIMNNGTILASGTKEELIQNEDARRIYFGDDFLNEGI
ncbi:MAG: LPS export ABC transporter ATP-binding protein [Sphaerochaetaceae bacterium]|nr:LPS export ABC transporter ATP-binding protein [Sphaerochaetaceae bacterium]